MSNETQINATKSISGIELLDITIARDSESGLRVRLQSNPDFWKPFRREDGSMIDFCGVKCYRAKIDQLQGVNGYFIHSERTPEYNGFPNLQMILAKDIGAGVEFNFGVFPISDSRIYEFIEKFKQQIKIIFLTYIKKVDIKVTFSTQTVELESHD